MFKIGDVIEPNAIAQEKYGVTRRPTMTKGVVVELHEGRSYSDIRVKITEGEEFDENGNVNTEIGRSYDVHSKHFDLAIPLTADEAFQSLLDGHLSDVAYEQIMKNIQKNT